MRSSVRSLARLSRKVRSHPLLALSWVIPFLVAPALFAQTATQFDLPAQPLIYSLKAVANQTNTNVLFDLKLVEGMQAPPLKGQLTPEGAVARLLARTGFSYALVNEHTIVLTARAEKPVASPHTTLGMQGTGGSASDLRVGQIDGATAITLSVPTLVTFGSALAQQVDQSKDAPPARPVLQEVLVTATKREKSVRDIPMSIDAFSGSDLHARGLTSLQEILSYSPGVTLIPGENPDSNQINIRGAGSSSGGFNRPFGTFFNDVPLINPTLRGAQPDLDPFDLATVEILKGPQGTLFGGSALVGAIRYVPNKPSFDEMEGNVSYGYGKTSESGGNNQQYTAMLNIPFGESFAIRYAGSVRDLPGVVDDTFSGEPDINGVKTEQHRVMAAWEPLDDLTLQFSYQDRSVDADSTIGNTIDNEEGRQETRALRDRPDYSVSELDIVGLTVDWSGFENFTLSMISNGLRNDADFASTQVAAIVAGGLEVLADLEQARSTDQWTHELRMVSSRPAESDLWLLRDWEYVSGLFYLESEQNVDVVGAVSIANPPIPISTTTAHLGATAEERAWYFDATRAFLGSRLELNVGGRYFRQRTPVLIQASGNPDTADTLEERGFNPKAALTARFADSISTYVSATKGFRFGGINADPFMSGEPPPFYESDSVWNYEFGVRSDWLDRRLQLDLTTFFIDWSNKQTSQSTSTAVRSEYIANTGGSRSRGAELAVRTVLPSGFSWMINGAYVDSETVKDFELPTGELVPAGTPEPNTSRWTAATVLDYRHQWSEWQVGASLGYAYRSAPERSLQNEVRIPEIQTVDLSFSLGNPGWKLAPQFNAQVINLTDEQSLVSGASNGPPGTPNRQIRAQTVRPRTVVFNVTFAF